VRKRPGNRAILFRRKTSRSSTPLAVLVSWIVRADWLRQRTDAPLELRLCTLSSPMHFGEIYPSTGQP
jgi:hypothetical protein